eukprot:c6540_g1_i2.p1 GENE.c6540_g1_i2~~c6540_g1_i2.p1  ORF type:complete len:153 (+),score=23.89 c6540_g1_i2:332-790(+)
MSVFSRTTLNKNNNHSNSRVSIFGGSLQHPVQSFFYLELGLTTQEMGILKATMSVGMLLNPLYGMLVDSGRSHIGMAIACWCCAFGCLFRGVMSSFGWMVASTLVIGLGGMSITSVILSYVTANTPPQNRTAVISGFLTQVNVLLFFEICPV